MVRMVTPKEIIKKYISFFEKRGHTRIPNASLIPENDPTTLFTSSGMQPLLPYLLGERHPEGKRLVNVQNCFRAVDIDEVGDNRHATFFRMLGNWSLGDYFKKEQLTWFFEFLTKELELKAERLYVTVFEGNDQIEKDREAAEVWEELFERSGVNADERIFYYGVEKNWWSRAGVPDNMPEGEPGGPDSEVFYDFGAELELHEQSAYKNQTCHANCECGRFWEIGNSVFMQYQKGEEGFCELPQKNVDFGGGLERLIGVLENQPDMFQNSLFAPIIEVIEKSTHKKYFNNKKPMQIIADHLVAGVFMSAYNVTPSNKEQGYILRRLIRRSLDNLYQLEGKEIVSILKTVVEQYEETDPYLIEKFEHIKLTILEEEQKYKSMLQQARKFIDKKYKGKKIGDELKGVIKISAEDAFILYTTHGFSPTQIKSLGYEFDEQEFAQKMEDHQKVSRAGAARKFAGGLADHTERTIMGHTATHLLHQALRDVLGGGVFQTGSNITAERVRFDFSFERALTQEELQRIEMVVNGKIKENLRVYAKIIDMKEAKRIGAIGLFEDTYGIKVKVYYIGGRGEEAETAYSKEFCGGPHVKYTGEVKQFTIIKEEGLGKGVRRIYARVGE